MYTVNKRIALEPLKELTLQTTDPTKGFLTAKQKAGLTPLKAVMPNYNYLVVANDHSIRVNKGDVVHVKGDVFAHAYAREIHKTPEGEEFILVPDEMVVAIEPVSVFVNQPIWISSHPHITLTPGAPDKPLEYIITGQNDGVGGTEPSK